MNINDIYGSLDRHFFLSLSMLESFIEICPDELWYETRGGFPFWQQLLHTYSGIHYWMRSTEKADDPFPGKILYPELDNIPEDTISKTEMTDYAKVIRKKCGVYFKNLPHRLFDASIVDRERTNLDVVLMLIRHIQYHVGGCDSILRGERKSPVAWLE
ncbi:MAG: DinB family protein [Spirochaetales bacterium]|nr:DinB family protein [Spirochaetales bacterium]